MPTSAPVGEITVEEYYRLADEGVFGPDARVELLDGEIIEMLPIGPFHARSTRWLVNYFARLGEGRWLVDAQHPVRLSNSSEPQPDFVLIRSLDEEYKTRHPTPEDVFLLVEVSDSSLRFDQSRKLAAYAKAGVKEYWIVNLVKRWVEIHRDPSPDGTYESVTRKHNGDLIAPEAFPDATVRVADLV